MKLKEIMRNYGKQENEDGINIFKYIRDYFEYV